MAVDPSKVTGTLESLYGPRAGRLISTVLATLAVLAGAFFLVNVIWNYGGRDILEFFGSIRPPDTAFITLENMEAVVLTLLIIVALFGTVFVAILFFLGRALLKKGVSQRALNELARLRNEGIEKIYNMKVSNSTELTDWIGKRDVWERNVIEHVRKNFPESDYLRLSHLGLVIPTGFPGIEFNSDHQTQLSFFAARVRVIEELLSSYRR